MRDATRAIRDPTRMVHGARCDGPLREVTMDPTALVEKRCAEAERPAARETGGRLALWRAGLARLSPDAAPCPGYPSGEWPRVYAYALAFLDQFGGQAERIGWQTAQLFGVHPSVGTTRVDHCGALMLTIS